MRLVLEEFGVGINLCNVYSNPKWNSCRHRTANNQFQIPKLQPMKKATVAFFMATSVSLFSNCFKKAHPTSKKTPAEEAEYAKTHYNDAQRAQGKTLFEASCAQCHDLPVPGAYTIPQLDDILPGMFEKAKMSYDDAGLVKAYMIYNAKK